MPCRAAPASGSEKMMAVQSVELYRKRGLLVRSCLSLPSASNTAPNFNGLGSLACLADREGFVCPRNPKSWD